MISQQYLSAWPLRTMLGPLPISVPVPPILAAYDTEIFRAQANKRNSLSSLAYISAHFASSISFRGTLSSLLQQKKQNETYSPPPILTAIFQENLGRLVDQQLFSSTCSRKIPLKTGNFYRPHHEMPFLSPNQQSNQELECQITEQHHLV